MAKKKTEKKEIEKVVEDTKPKTVEEITTEVKEEVVEKAPTVEINKALLELFIKEIDGIYLGGRAHRLLEGIKHSL
jgi:hypothetical protein